MRFTEALLPALRSKVFVTGAIALLLLVLAALSLHDRKTQTSTSRAVHAAITPPKPAFRAALLILDSVGTRMAFGGELMPYVASLRKESLWGEAKSCPGNATFPCVKTLLEGREATLGTTLQNFSATASTQPSFPSSLAARGVRIAAASDHTLNRLYPGAYVDSFNYESLQANLMARDASAFRHAFRWLADRTIDLLIVHEIGTDKVSHEYRVGGPEYRAKYREVDQFVHDVAARLGPSDYLFLVADHGHGDNGGHKRDAMYLMHGPVFPHDVERNIHGEDILPLLSIPYAQPLPPSFEGTLNTKDLTLSSTQRRAYLESQAKLYGLSSTTASADELEASINQHIILGRLRGSKAQAFGDFLALAPWLCAAVLLLVLSGIWLMDSDSRGAAINRSDASWLIGGSVLGALVMAAGTRMADPDAAALSAAIWVVPFSYVYVAARESNLRQLFLMCVAAAMLVLTTFWVGPTWLGWFHQGPHRMPGTLIYFGVGAVLSTSAAWLWQRYRGSEHDDLIEIAQWILATSVWLTSYFGVYFYSLTRLAPITLLIALVFSACVKVRVKSLLTPRVLGLAALVPVMIYNAESYNIQFSELSRLATLPSVVRGGIVLILGAVLCALLALRGRRLLDGVALLLAWLIVSSGVFEFEAGQIAGFLLISIAFSGMLVLIERAGLSARWTALCAAVCAYLMWCVGLNGFALSRVDFRFASQLIVPLREELWRAVQLIAWAIVKYAFILAPLFAMLLRLPTAARVAAILSHLTWSRLGMIALSALGLRLFGLPGVHELCSEEMYFWATLSVAFWIFATLLARRSARLETV